MRKCPASGRGSLGSRGALVRCPVTSCGGSSRSRPLGCCEGLPRARGPRRGWRDGGPLLLLRLGYGTGARGADDGLGLLVTVPARLAVFSGAQRLRLECFCPGGGGHIAGTAPLQLGSVSVSSWAAPSPRFPGPFMPVTAGRHERGGKCLPGLWAAARFRDKSTADTRVQRPADIAGNPHHSARLVTEVNRRQRAYCLPPGISTRRQSGNGDHGL